VQPVEWLADVAGSDTDFAVRNPSREIRQAPLVDLLVGWVAPGKNLQTFGGSTTTEDGTPNSMAPHDFSRETREDREVRGAVRSSSWAMAEATVASVRSRPTAIFRSMVTPFVR
jgi:hypothetical protein